MGEDQKRSDEWRRFDYGNKAATAPEPDELVWIVDEDGVTVGYFDGFTFCLWSGTDDCHVSWWAPMRYPQRPAEPR